MQDSRNERSIRRPVIVTAFLLVAVAAMLVAFRSWFEWPRVEDIDEPAVVAVDEGPIVPLEEPSVEPSAAVEPQTPAAVAPALVPARAPTRVILLPGRSKNRDPSAEAFLHRIRESMLRALGGMAIEVIDIGAAEYAAVVPPNAGALADDRLVYLAVIHRYGGWNVAEIFEDSSRESPSWSISLKVVRSGGMSRSGASVRKNGDPDPENTPESIGTGFAETLSRNVTIFGAAQASRSAPVLLDPTRSEQERLRALSLVTDAGLDSTTLGAAIDFGTRSPSAATRRAVWETLRQGVYDPALAQPLSRALLSDADAGVRTEAALALAAYTRDPRVLSSLEQAGRNDSSSDVRVAARMSTLDYEARQTFVREALLNRNLSPAERLAPTVIAGSAEPSWENVLGTGAEGEALAYAEIAAAADDPVLKARALSELQVASLRGTLGAQRPDQRVDPTITRVLIDSARHEDERVSRVALGALTQQYARARSIPTQQSEPINMEIRAVLETAAREQPELARALNIEELLRPPEVVAAPSGLPTPRNIGRPPQ